MRQVSCTPARGDKQDVCCTTCLAREAKKSCTYWYHCERGGHQVSCTPERGKKQTVPQVSYSLARSVEHVLPQVSCSIARDVKMGCAKFHANKHVVTNKMCAVQHVLHQVSCTPVISMLTDVKHVVHQVSCLQAMVTNKLCVKFHAHLRVT